MADNYTENKGNGWQSFAADKISGDLYPRMKIAQGADGTGVDVSEANPLHVAVSDPLPALNALPKSYEDASFVTGDSPVVLDLATDMARDAIGCNIENKGAGALTYAISVDGAVFSDEFTLDAGMAAEWSNQVINKLRLTWVADTAYVVRAF